VGAVSGPLVLCYHAVSERWPAPLSVTPERFEWQLESLVRRGYRGARFLDVALGRADGRALAVTFDDAYRSVLELALPILERLGLVGSVFAPTSFVGSAGPMAWPGIDQWLGGPFEPELRCLSWEELGELRRRGWEVGSHTRTHPRLTGLGDAELREELAGSRDECEQGLGESCATLAYPYGDWDERVARAAGDAGYAAACTLPARFHEAAPLSWPRVGVYHADSDWRFRLKVSPLVRRARATPLWDRLGALRSGTKPQRQDA
jgi:peptidoglycan/xylan/chitin deacetylase (PgdA/CDA1 family)